MTGVILVQRISVSLIRELRGGSSLSLDASFPFSFSNFSYAMISENATKSDGGE